MPHVSLLHIGGAKPQVMLGCNRQGIALSVSTALMRCSRAPVEKLRVGAHVCGRHQRRASEPPARRESAEALVRSQIGRGLE